MGGAPDLLTDDVNVELALGKDGALGPDLGKVLEDLPTEDFLTTCGGPDGSSRLAFRCCEEGGLEAPWKTTLESTAGVEPGLED